MKNIEVNSGMSWRLLFSKIEKANFILDNKQSHFKVPLVPGSGAFDDVT